MDRIIFGDNQFFGVNHMSEEKARAQSMRFRDTRAIMNVLDIAYSVGIRTFMCTTHDSIAEICNHIRANPKRYADFKFYPGMPYAHKYANAVTESGMIGALKRFVPGSIIGTVLKGGKAVATRDFIAMMKILIDTEMKMFAGLNTEVIFLQNVMTDLLLGLNLKEIFVAFSDHVKKKYRAEPGFFTMNLPRLLTLLEDCGIENPIICSSINKIGFRMCGGRELYEKVIRENEFRPIAMSVLASGAISPEEALEYICNKKQIRSIVFGASTRAHIEQTKELIEKYS
ncbi:MAG: hypothetical protein FVQ85_14765 [Planctomycetes bacterium]|nr:hypothetical protein [Planctomycetota bacterium]